MSDEQPQPNANALATTPEANQTKPDSFKESFQKVQGAGFYILLLIGSCAIPAQVAHSQNSQGTNQLLTFLHFFLATAPFTSAVAIIGLGIIRGWFDSIQVLLLMGTLILVAATLLGGAFGLLVPGKDPTPFLKGSVYTMVFRLIVFYYTSYGLWTFLVSIAVGIFLAWAGGKIMWPHAQTFIKGLTPKK